MNEQLETAIQALVKKSIEAERSDDAMKFAQAATNLAQAFGMLEHAKR